MAKLINLLNNNKLLSATFNLNKETNNLHLLHYTMKKPNDEIITYYNGSTPSPTFKTELLQNDPILEHFIIEYDIQDNIRITKPDHFRKDIKFYEDEKKFLNYRMKNGFFQGYEGITAAAIENDTVLWIELLEQEDTLELNLKLTDNEMDQFINKFYLQAEDNNYEMNDNDEEIKKGEIYRSHPTKDYIEQHGSDEAIEGAMNNSGRIEK